MQLWHFGKMRACVLTLAPPSLFKWETRALNHLYTTPCELIIERRKKHFWAQKKMTSQRMKIIGLAKIIVNLFLTSLSLRLLLWETAELLESITKTLFFAYMVVCEGAFRTGFCGKAFWSQTRFFLLNYSMFFVMHAAPLEMELGARG